MSLRDWLESSNSSESSETLQGLSSSASCIVRSTSAASIGPCSNKNLLMPMIWELKTGSCVVSEVGSVGIFCQL